MFLHFMAALGLDYTDQLLRLGRLATRNHKASARLQLRNQGIWNARAAGCSQNSIVWTICSPSQRPVKGFNCGVVDSKFANPTLRLAREFADTFNRINLRSELRKHGGLIARA